MHTWVNDCILGADDTCHHSAVNKGPRAGSVCCVVWEHSKRSHRNSAFSLTSLHLAPCSSTCPSFYLTSCSYSMLLGWLEDFRPQGSTCIHSCYYVSLTPPPSDHYPSPRPQDTSEESIIWDGNLAAIQAYNTTYINNQTTRDDGNFHLQSMCFTRSLPGFYAAVLLWITMSLPIGLRTLARLRDVCYKVQSWGKRPTETSSSLLCYFVLV